ncbi:FHA domain-containing protein [Streptomyces sp. TRM49041]|uniref:FHA domain-containing protein n=1 Tax=Streptomyces sp. TRM49041 TaxID=2603216 RepID=UPI0011EC2DEC|nr:FHA domain-containing protein [Streptomyces sp. TRM49041]
MQIRLTVLAAPPGGQTARRACDVLVTAPAGTALAAVASGLAAAVAGPDGAAGTGPVVLYAGPERLDPQRCALGDPPLVDGAVLALQSPAEEAVAPDGAAARLHVVAGPDAGGVHLLDAGHVRIGRSADADVPLDDPDVSRLHCVVTVGDDGRVTVADLDSTNGTTLDGKRVGTRAVRLKPGALLRVGESVLRLVLGGGGTAGGGAAGGGGVAVAGGAGTQGLDAGVVDGARGGGAGAVGGGGGAPGGARGPSGAPESTGSVYGGVYGDPYGAPLATTPDGEGYVRVARLGAASPRAGAVSGVAGAAEAGVVSGSGDGAPRAGSAGGVTEPGAVSGGGRAGSGSGTGLGGEVAGPGAPGGTGASVVGPGGAPQGGALARAGTSDGCPTGGAGSGGAVPMGGAGSGAGAPGGDPVGGDLVGGAEFRGVAPGGADPGPGGPGDAGAGGAVAPRARRSYDGQARAGYSSTGQGAGGSSGGGHARAHGVADGGVTHSRTAAPGGPQGTPARGTPVPAEAPRRRGIGAWARRLAGGRADGADHRGSAARTPATSAPAALRGPGAEAWPDPAAVLLTALGPGPRLWERAPGHPESLVVRLGTTDRAELAAVPVTVGLREARSLGIAGPRARLVGLARSVVAQLTALHAPADLEIVLISADRARPLEERRRDWAWLGWLPHVRPAHGQDCRLLLAYDGDQAAARAAELTRRLDDGPLGPGWADADHNAVAEAAERFQQSYATGAPQSTGPYTVVIVDGDPGTSALRETTARLAGAGAAAGIHLVCLAETAPASAVFPVAAAYEAACAESLPFRECGAVGLLTGDVATALRVMRAAGGHPVGHGTVAAVDAVSGAWAERFARSLAPLRAEGPAQHGRATAAALPRSSRLLDELELARATPASLMARWASAPDGTAVLGTGPHGPLRVDLTGEGPHLLVEGPAGSGRTELLRSLAASLAAASRPDRLGLLLVDGAGGERGEGLGPCTDLPHVTEHLVAADPVRMRAFAQALGAELKRRAEVLGREGFTEAPTRRNAPADERAGLLPDPRTGVRPETGPRVQGDQRRDAPRNTGPDAQRPGDRAFPEQRVGGDVESPPSGTLRLRPAAPGGRGQGGTTPPPLPLLVVLVDDLDALVAPALGSPGRPAAGSVVRALEAVARDGERLGVHLVAASARPDRTADTEPARRARLRVVLDAAPASPGPDDPLPGRGRLCHPDGRVTPFQAGRVTGRIPRTATLRPTVVPLEWERMGDPPTRRPVRELGNGPTDLALLASALDRAARSVQAAPVPPLTAAPDTSDPVR